MSSEAAPDFARERQLIEKLEFRIASADTAEKLQTILLKFLAPLLLKLASEDVSNRNLTIKACQYINQRLKIDSSIQLPVEALSKTLRDSENAFVKQFSLLFLQQGLSRLSRQDAISILPAVLRSSLDVSGQDPSNGKLLGVAMDLLLRVLQHWKPPEHESQEDMAMKNSFQLSTPQARTISRHLSYFLLFDPKDSPQWFVHQDLQPVFQQHFAARASIAPNIAAFLHTSLFDDEARFVPATILSINANATASSRADMIFKQCNFDLESDALIDAAFSLYQIAKPRLQTRILTLLSRSKESTTRINQIVSVIESQLTAPALNLEAAKLRTAMFSYLIWVIRSNPDIGSVADRLLDSLKEFVEMQGWPNATSLTQIETDLRCKAYESIGLVASVRPQQQLKDEDDMDTGDRSMFSLVSWLFTSLKFDTARDARHSIEDSLSRLMTKGQPLSEEELDRFRSLLLSNVLARPGDEDLTYNMPIHASAQYPAVRFANKLLDFSDVDGRTINIIALASDRREVVEEGQRGLDPAWHSANRRIAAADRQGEARLPTFENFFGRVFEIAAKSQEASAAMRTPASINGLVAFSRNLIACQAWHDSSYVLDPDTDWQKKIDATLDNDNEARSLFRMKLTQLQPDAIIKLLEVCYAGFSQRSVECGRIGLQLTSLVQNEILQKLDKSALLDLRAASQHLASRQLACRLQGIMLSARPEWEQELRSSLLGCEGWPEAVGQQLAEKETHLLESACILSRAALRGYSLDGEAVTAIWTLCKNIILTSTDKSLRDTAYFAIGQIGMCFSKTSHDTTHAKEIFEAMLADAKKENEIAIASLGRLLSLVWQDLDEADTDKYLGRLYDLHEVRKAEFHFALGEAFAVAALRFDSSSTLTEFDVDAARYETQTRSALYHRLVEDILEKSRTTKPAMRKASGIWLLSLIQFCSLDRLVQPYLRDCQTAFSRLLTDRDDVVQETGSRGLGIVYEKGDRSLREELVKDLIQSFTGNNAKTSGTITEDTQLFEPGALPTENGQSVTTYKDIVSLAQEMGDPSLVYRFMNLASNNAVWTSRAAFGRFGLSGVLADSTYLKDNKKFYPKLFRYRFDPNPNVQRSMNDIWKALVKDTNTVVDEHFDLIMEDLLKSVLSGREWRAREASCAAISELVQGREVDKFEKYLDEIWNVAFKVLDDIKESVRLGAMKLCRTLTSMLIRNLEVGEGTTKRASTMLNHAMPFLLDQMEGKAGNEVQQYAIVTLLEIVKKAPPKSLRAYAPVILEKLVNSLSSLEHESINYLHLNADKYGLTADKLDSMRVSSIGASPVSEAIEKCLDSLAVDLSTEKDGILGDATTNHYPFEDALKRLESSFKVAIGLPSKVGLARVMTTLVVRHHAAFRPYADRFVRLTRKNILDRNATISQSFSLALAYLLRLASEKEIRQTVAYAQKLYFEFQETSHRVVAGEILQSISKASNDVFTNFAALFLPFAFIGRNDLDEDANDRFDAAWRDNVGGPRALTLYLTEISDLLQKNIKSSLWPIRHACCFAVADLTTSMQTEGLYTKASAVVLWPLVDEALAGKTWDGKERIIQAWPRFVEGAQTLWPDHSKDMVKISLREAKRTNLSYRPHALNALAEFARMRRDLDMSSDVVPFLVNVMESLLEHSDAMNLENTSSQDARSSEILVDETLSSAIKCLLAVVRKISTAEVLDQSLSIIKKAHSKNSSAVEKSLYSEVSKCLAEVIDHQGENDAETTKAAMIPGSVARMASQEANHKFGEFWDGLAFELFNPEALKVYPSSAEPFRKSIVDTALKLSTSAVISFRTRETLIQLLASWLEDERSKPLRTLLEEAIEANRKAMSLT